MDYETYISIHTALAGCDPYELDNSWSNNISIHTALAGCDGRNEDAWEGYWISIHTALAGCDSALLADGRAASIFQSTQPSQAVTPGLTVLSNTLYISIHTALAGCDLVHHVQYHAQLIFQSTQPSQAVTAWAGSSWPPRWNFNPHSPRRLWQQ